MGALREATHNAEACCNGFHGHLAEISRSILDNAQDQADKCKHYFQNNGLCARNTCIQKLFPCLLHHSNQFVIPQTYVTMVETNILPTISMP